MTWIVSGVAVVSVVVLTWTVIKLRRRPEPPDVTEPFTFTPPVPPPAHAAGPRRTPARTGLAPARPLPRFTTSATPPDLSRTPASAPLSEQDQVRAAAKEDGVLFREAGTDAVYVVQRGTKFKVPNENELAALGYSPDKVRQVSKNALAALPDRPPERTLLRERGTWRVFVYEDGAKRWITDQESLKRAGHDWQDVRVVPVGSLGEFPDGPPVR
jgi:PAS domain-containing protein